MAFARQKVALPTTSLNLSSGCVPQNRSHLPWLLRFSELYDIYIQRKSCIIGTFFTKVSVR